MVAQSSAGAASNHTTLWIAVAVVIVVAIIIAILSYRRNQRTAELRSRFGPEYERHVRTIGSQSEAEAELLERERRHQSLHIKPLPADAKQRYVQEWRSVQSRFVDEPKEAIHEADRIIQSVMQERGYPVGDFHRATEDLSVEHADVLDNYRLAHRIAMKTDAGDASTEEMRQAIIAYRALFESLVGTMTVKTT